MAVEDGIRIPYHYWVRLNDAVVVVAVLVEECLEECHGLMPLLRDIFKEHHVSVRRPCWLHMLTYTLKSIKWRKVWTHL